MESAPAFAVDDTQQAAVLGLGGVWKRWIVDHLKDLCFHVCVFYV